MYKVQVINHGTHIIQGNLQQNRYMQCEQGPRCQPNVEQKKSDLPITLIWIESVTDPPFDVLAEHEYTPSSSWLREGKVRVEEVVVTDTPDVTTFWPELDKKSTARKVSLKQTMHKYVTCSLLEVFACQLKHHFNTLSIRNSTKVAEQYILPLKSLNNQYICIK